MNDKYLVIKRSDWDAILVNEAKPALKAEVGRVLNLIAEKELPDAVVIRRQDVFAPPALDAYANAITVGLQVLSAADGGANIYDATIPKRLRQIADYFHAQAEEAWHTDRKIPD